MLIAIVVIVILVVSVTAVYFAFQNQSNSGVSVCDPLGSKTELSGSAIISQQGDIKDYILPNPSKLPNKLTVAPDGSVWFGEQSVPGVGHLFPNGSLVEYAWPAVSFKPPPGGCQFKTGYMGSRFVEWNGLGNGQHQ